MIFPNLANLPAGVVNVLSKRIANNVHLSQKMPWMRISSAYKGGLTIESVHNSNTFEENYGDTTKSGRIGVDFAGNSVFPEGQDRAFRPSPTIEALSLQLNAGAFSRKTSFSIKCYTLKQAELVQEYFNEPGYTVLVEFGWNEPQVIQQRADLKGEGPCAMARYNNYFHVKEKEEASNYEYSGYLGYITNGSLKSGEGESYTLEVEITSIAEIPAFLQTHKTANLEIESDKTQTGETFNENTIEKIADDDVGTALFMQMYNRLPKTKQIVQVKNLHKKGRDSRGYSWTHSGNFLNMDDKIREELSEGLVGGARINTDKSDSRARIPDGVNMFSSHSFIRVELAFEILNQYRINIKTREAPECSGIKTYDFRISIEDTLCRGFKNMFSIDGSKLFIPNKNHPYFDHISALTSKKPINNYIELNPLGSKEPLSKEYTTDLSRGITINRDYSFPQTKPLNEYKWLDGTITQEHPAYSYGYLKDLFINFEYFCEVIDRVNVVNKDIYYELLNGLSAGVDNYWYFDLEENANHTTGDKHITVHDLTLCTPDRSKFGDCPKLFATGVNTPFTNSSFDISIPAAMKNSILGKRASQPANINTDGSTNVDLKNKETGERTTLFATERDPVLDILASFQIDDIPEDLADEEKPDKKDQDEIRSSNFELFLQYADVYTKQKNRTGDYDIKENSGGFLGGAEAVLRRGFSIITFGLVDGDGADSSAEDVLIVGAWRDAGLFNKLWTGSESSSAATNILVPITFEFETFGITGIVTGQLFRIVDLPSRYNDTAFQVIEVGHNLSGGMWKTTVKGQLRNF